MQRIVSFVLLLVLVSLIAAGSCFIVGRYTKNYRTEPAMGLHAVIHERLKLTKEQDKQLDPIEARFAEKRRHYAELIRIANTELADAIVADQADSPASGTPWKRFTWRWAIFKRRLSIMSSR